MLDSWLITIVFFIVAFAAVQFYEVSEGRVRANMAGFFVLLGMRSLFMGSIFITISMAFTAFSKPPEPHMLMSGAVVLLGMTVLRHIFGRTKDPRS
jgi:hypothetical protein